MKVLLSLALLSAIAQFPGLLFNVRLHGVTYGPSASITCPVGAVDVATSDDLQTKMLASGNGQAFCIKAGVHVITSGSTPRTGQTFTGEVGAILDGSTWVTSDPDEAAIKARNSDTDNIVIRNLVIRNMPQGAIDAYKDFSDGWVIENNEIHNNKDGVSLPNSSTLRYNYLHHNEGDPNGATAAEWGGSYGGYQSNGILIESNEISYGGYEQKFLDSLNVIFRYNFIHHNRGDGIWYDGQNSGMEITGNRLEDNGRHGIDYEAGLGGTISSNTVLRSGDTGIFITTSQNTETFNNTVLDNFRGITYFVNCGALPPVQDVDLANNDVYDNTIRVDATVGAFAAGLSYSGDCSPAQITTYHDGSKNNTFTNNDYDVPNVANAYWLWNAALKTWAQWQAIPHDVTGSVQ